MLAWTTPLRFHSTASLLIGENDSETVARIVAEVLSRSSLAGVISDPRLHLYPDQIRKHPIEDVVDSMRRNLAIGVRMTSASSGTLDLSFTYFDRYKAQITTTTIVGKLQEAVRAGHYPMRAYPPASDYGTIDPKRPAKVSSGTSGRNSAILLNGFIAGILLAGLISIFRNRWTPPLESTDHPTEPDPIRSFRRPRFRKLASSLAAAGAITGLIVSLSISILQSYSSTALVSFENMDRTAALKLLKESAEEGVSVRAVKGGMFALDSTTGDPAKAQTAVRNTLSAADKAVQQMHGASNPEFERVRGVDGELLKDLTPADNPPPRHDELFNAPVSPVTAFIPSMTVPEKAPEFVPAEHHDVQMNVIDPPNLPTRLDSGMIPGLIILGTAAGVLLAVVITLFRKSAGRPTPQPSERAA